MEARRGDNRNNIMTEVSSMVMPVSVHLSKWSLSRLNFLIVTQTIFFPVPKALSAAKFSYFYSNLQMLCFSVFRLSFHSSRCLSTLLAQFFLGSLFQSSFLCRCLKVPWPHLQPITDVSVLLHHLSLRWLLYTLHSRYCSAFINRFCLPHIYTSPTSSSSDMCDACPLLELERV